MKRPSNRNARGSGTNDRRANGKPASATRRRLLTGGAAAAIGGAALVSGVPYVSRARAADKPLSGTTLNVTCWSAPYPKYLADYIPEFEAIDRRQGEFRDAVVSDLQPAHRHRAVDRERAYDVINVTFIYIGRWIGAGWVSRSTSFIKDPTKTPADWDVGDFLGGTTAR